MQNIQINDHRLAILNVKSPKSQCVFRITFRCLVEQLLVENHRQMCNIWIFKNVLKCFADSFLTGCPNKKLIISLDSPALSISI